MITNPRRNYNLGEMKYSTSFVDEEPMIRTKKEAVIFQQYKSFLVHVAFRCNMYQNQMLPKSSY